MTVHTHSLIRKVFDPNWPDFDFEVLMEDAVAEGCRFFGLDDEMQNLLKIQIISYKDNTSVGAEILISYDDGHSPEKRESNLVDVEEFPLKGGRAIYPPF